MYCKSCGREAAQLRLKKATAGDEITCLRRILKHSIAIHAVLSAAAQFGVSSKSFAETFDMQQTSLNLEPQVTVPWPPHILWSRHRLNIQSVVEVSAWAAMISSKELATNGAPSLAVDQENLIGERLASYVKLEQYSEVKHALETCFELSREWDLEVAAEDFCFAVSVAVRYDCFDTLDETIEVLEDAISTIEDSHAKNSPMALGLMGWPKGKKVVEDMKLHHVLGKQTRDQNAIVESSVVACMEYLKPIAESEAKCFSKSDLSSLIHFVDEFAKMDEAFKLADADCIPEFFVGTSNADVSEVITLLSGVCCRSWKNALSGLLTKDCDQGVLEKWAALQSNNADEKDAIKLAELLDKLHIILTKRFVKDDLPYRYAVGRTKGVRDWAVRLHAYILSPFAFSSEGAGECGHLWKYINTLLVPVRSADADDIFGLPALVAFQQSPIMQKSSELMCKLLTCARSAAMELLNPIDQAMADIIGGGATSLCLRSMSKDDLQKHVDRHIDEKSFAAATAWAKESNDKQLSLQLGCLYHIATFLKRCAQQEVMHRTAAELVSSNAKTKYASTKISTAAVDALKDLIVIRMCIVVSSGCIAKVVYIARTA